MKKFYAILLTMVMVLSLAACGGQKDSNPAAEAPAEEAKENPGQESAGEEQGADEAGEAVNPSDLTIATVISSTDQFFIMQSAGVEAACKEYGVNFVSATDNNNQAEKQNIVNTYIAQGVDAIVHQVGDNNAEIFRTAAEEGMLVGTLTSFPDNDFTAAGYGYSQYALGSATGEYGIQYVKEQLDGKAKIHIERVSEGNITDARGDAFIDALTKEFGEENIQVVSTGNAIEVQTAMQQVRDALTANPDIDIVFCESEIDLDGAISAIEQLEMEDTVVCFAVDISEPMCLRLLDENDNVLQGCGGQDIYVNAYNTTVDLIQILLGEKDYTPGAYEEVEALDLNKGNLDAVQAYLDQLREVTGS